MSKAIHSMTAPPFVGLLAVGIDPKVSSLVYVAARAPDAGED